MSNLALYRKYRPDSFSNVYGQDTITRILKNQIATDRVGHAYLFSGIRGTGKTSIAKIFAKAVNCEHPIDGNPCNECQTCKLLNSPSSMDIVEIDAASNRGVDEIRELRETINYPPTSGKYKVYIIDEVHMLTKEAFNALLKTLEEPPEHAIFILATTEPHKLPATILSRCQKFTVKPLSINNIKDRMAEICSLENLNIEDGALEEIAIRADHSMRDGLSILDQCADLELPGDLITKEEVEEFLGISPKDQLVKIAELQADHNTNELINTLDTIRKQGREDQIFLEDLINFYKELLYFKITGTKDQGFHEKFPELAKKLTNEELYVIIDTLINAFSKLRFNSLSSIIVDTALLQLCIGENFNEIESSDNIIRNDYTISKDPTPIIKNFQNKDKPKIISTESTHEPEPIFDDEIPPFDINSSENYVFTPPEPVPIFNEEPVIDISSDIETIPDPSEIELAKPVEQKESVVQETKIVNNPKEIKEKLYKIAGNKNERLIQSLLENSEFIVNKHGLFILVENRDSFMFKSPDFKQKLQSIVNEAFGHSTNVYPKLKEHYYAHFNKKPNTNVNQDNRTTEEKVKDIVGDHIDYKKVDD